MSKYKKEYWNYRIGTEIIPAKIGVNLKDQTTLIHDNYRVFSIIRVYYKNGKPNSYSELNAPVTDWENLKEIKTTLKRMKKALKKPILNIDKFPKKWQEK